MSDPLAMGDVNTEHIGLRTFEASVMGGGGDEEVGDAGTPLAEQSAVSDEEPGDREEEAERTCNDELFCLILSLVLMSIDQFLDGFSSYKFYVGGYTLFFVLNLVFTVIPALCLHLGATVALKLSWWKALLCFPVAPWVLLGKVIHNRIKGDSTEEQKDLKRNSKNMSVCEGFFEAVPQLLIQMTALRLGISKESGVILTCVKMVFSCVCASLALLSRFREGMSKPLQGVSVFLVAMVLGSRVFVCASLFSLPSPRLYTGFLPLALSVLLACVTDYVFEREKVSLSRAYIKATLLPPEDKAGGMASLVYCAFGLVFWLLTVSRPLSVLVFVCVTVIHILGGIGWMVLKQYDKSLARVRGRNVHA
ncbi:uncharacterized protein LOC119579559 isoform X1 [Penaeus monodon]|uniref:uncharacterized protein LOC119579559 isoform X1 n=1 Tax=Penaeus monodon TaxID=6687 RepID=UPI0018A7B723|nr:uncharacterized protein LOC119579559 isoform X1 [Penaeus monodon]